MKIWIITMEDPLYTNDFIKDVIKAKHEQIVGLTIAKGGRLKVGKKNSKVIYLLSLLLIMGPFQFLKNVLKTLVFKLQKKISEFVPFINSSGLEYFANSYGIQVNFVENPNNDEFINELESENLDLIINQSQFIIKEPLLNIPSKGMINRHNALLPRNRGRLTPFWVLYNKEVETGVSIHFVEEGIDSGDIIVQKRFKVNKSDSFNSIVEKNYDLASTAMIEAIELIEQNHGDYLINSDKEATYNTLPTFSQALEYRVNLLRRKC